MGSPPSFSVATHDLRAEKTGFAAPSAVFEYEKKPGMLRKSSDRPFARLMALTHSYASESTNAPGLKGGRKREAVKFRPLSHEDAFSSDDDNDDQTKVDDALSLPPPQRHLSTRTTSSRTLASGFDSRTKFLSSEATLETDGQREKRRMTGTGGTFDDAPIPEYSDGEGEDVTAGSTIRRGSSGRSLPFTTRHRNSNADVLPLVPMVPGQRPYPPIPSAGAVPMTASLMHALDRVAVAQKDALINTSNVEPVGLPVAANSSPVLPKYNATGPSFRRSSWSKLGFFLEGCDR